MEKFLAKVPKFGDASNVALAFLASAVEIAEPKLRELHAQAREQDDYLRATLTQFKLDLEQGVTDKVIRSPK